MHTGHTVCISPSSGGPEGSKTTRDPGGYYQNKNVSNDKIKNNMNNYNKVSKVSVGIQTEKFVISTLLKGYKAPPTPPN